MPARRLRIHGLVQGVGYRESMWREAEKLGISGWVRNRRDGTVEALVCGPDDAISVIIAWARHGPRLSLVERVLIEEDEATVTASFTVIPTE
ncbi:MAG TPA: acylphosphatase [Methylophilaceae bacterium]|nr:acylphosphatase [Methylophilaceae bacterium]HQR59989.1 acylphosphatase [Methylophilaceae bacterium]